MKAQRDSINGSDVIKVILENNHGLRTELLSYGACIRKIDVLSDGEWRTLTQSFTDIDEYVIRNTAYAGKTLGPCAGRFTVADGIHLDDGTVFHPSANERGTNCLHGGVHSVSTQNWLLRDLLLEENKAAAVFETSQRDGLDGWPGNRAYRVEYILDNNNELTIYLEAESDKNTYINMSNHVYWNLNIDPSRAMGQIIRIFAERTAINSRETGVPYLSVPITETEEENDINFSRENTIRDLSVFDRDTVYSAQIKRGKGLNNAFLFGYNPEKNTNCRCILQSADRKIATGMYSDAPAMVIYGSGSMDEGLELENGQISSRNGSVAVEFQDMPTIQNIPTLHPGEKFRRTISFRFSFI